MSAIEAGVAPADRRTPLWFDRAVLATGFAVGTGLYLWRVWGRLRPPGIFAEDGLVFYLQAAEIGWPAILRPYAGYLHVLPRLGAAAVAPFGLPAVPVAYSLFTVAVTIGLFSLVLARRLDHFIPSAWGRALGFVLLCCVPQVWETATVMASLIFTGGIGLVLLGLSRAPLTTRGRIAEAVLVVVLGLSGPLIAFFSPLFVRRWWRERTRPNLLLLGLVAATSLVQLLVYLLGDREAASHPVRDAGRVYLQRVTGELLGSRSAMESMFQQHQFGRWLVVGWLAAVLVVVVTEVRWDAVVALAVSAFALTWALRAYGGTMMTDPTSGDRHILVPSSVLVLCVVATLAHAIRRAAPGTARRWWHVGAAVIALATLLTTARGVAAGWRIPAFDHIPAGWELRDFQACLDDGRRDCVPVEIAPYGFVLDATHPWDAATY